MYARIITLVSREGIGWMGANQIDRGYAGDALLGRSIYAFGGTGVREISRRAFNLIRVVVQE